MFGPLLSRLAAGLVTVVAAWVAWCIVRRPATTKHIYRPWYRALMNAIMGPLSLAGLLPIRTIKAEECVKQAVKATGFDDFGENKQWQQNLDRFLTKVHRDNHRDAAGSFILRGKIISVLTIKLELEAAYAKLKASGREKPLPPVVVIMGFPRTGTTLLHHLLDKDPNTKGILFPEILRPGASKEKQLEMATFALKMQNLFCPQFEGIHKREMEEPDECFHIFDLDFSDILYVEMCKLENKEKLEWLESEQFDLLDTYKNTYQRALKVLCDNYAQRGEQFERLIVKCPFHQRSVAALAEALGKDRPLYIIHPHRDLSKAVGSVASLFSSYQGTFTAVDPVETGELTIEMLHRSWTEFHTWEEEHASEFPNVHIQHVRFEQFVKDPKDTVKKIFARFGFEFSDQFAENIDAYLEKSARERQGLKLHSYSLSDFNLTEKQIQEKFADYDEFISNVPLLK